MTWTPPQPPPSQPWGEPTPKDPRPVWRRHPVWLGVVALLVLFFVIGAVANAFGGGSKGSAVATPADSSQPPAVVSTPSFTPTPPATPDAKARYTQSCDYLLGNFTDTAQGFRFIARTTIHNTGNVGAVIVAKASWVQVGSKDVTKSKIVRVPWHGRKVVNFSVVVNQDAIDKIQADTGLNNCHVKATIIKAYGQAH